VVEHHDELDLATVCRKMREAGARGARIFAAQHPEAYQYLGYAAIDAKLHPLRGRVARIFEPLQQPVLAFTSKFLERRWLPFALRSFMVRALSGYSYLLGTTEVTNAPKQ
jgi:hypothetical protein